MSAVTDQPPSPKRYKWRAVLDVIATVAMIITAGVVIWSVVARTAAPAGTQPSVPVPTEALAVEGIPTVGSAEATVLMLMFSDFECPFCSRFAGEIVPSLKNQYVDAGKVRMSFRHFPLPIHLRAVRAAEAAECAERQGRFWPMHDSLFKPPVRLDGPDLEGHAREVGLDHVRFTSCMEGEAADRVTADTAIGRTMGVTGTPTIIIGVTRQDGTIRATEVIVGMRPLRDFAAALDRALVKP